MGTDKPLQVRASAGVGERRAYGVPKAAGEISLKLDANEGASPPAGLIDVLRLFGPELLRRYPDASPLRKQFAARLGVGEERVVVTAGGDDAIDRACRAVLGPGAEIIVTPPTFEMFERYAQLVGAKTVEVPWLRGAFPTEAVIASVTVATKAIAIVTPNNPTGLVATADDVRRVAEAAPGALVIVDLAYTEFAERDLTASVLEIPNAIVIRTMSKAWGLAGLRVGYAAGDSRVIDWLRVAGGPYTVSSASVGIASAWLGEADEAVARYVERVKGERGRIGEKLRSLGCEVWASEANFVFARVAGALDVHKRLGEAGISVRAFPGKAMIADCLRITCPGNEEDLERLLGALEEAVVAVKNGRLA